ncbi:MAG: DUF1592 domain-containing protein [Gemmatimonadetes bacterium]|nr:DUF1592 domain-containing protein [Gemmatimonadota bacterium]
MMRLVASAAVSGTLLVVAGAVTVVAPPAADRDPHPTVAAGPPSAADLTDVVQEYCVGCHNDRRLTGNLSLETFDVATAPERAPVAERMVVKLRAGMMPPPGARRPGPDTLLSLVETLEDRLDAAARERPDPGRRVFQRLNRAEYERSVFDLLGMDVDAGAWLPLDTKSANFDNIADVQMPSPTLLDAYLGAAAEISRLAVGYPDVSETTVSWKVPRLASQRERVPGAPRGTRGGISVVHHFPADGSYVFSMEFQPSPDGENYGRAAPFDESIELSIDGARAALLPIDRWSTDSDPDGLTYRTGPIRVAAGPHRVSAAFVRTFEGPVNDNFEPMEHSIADTQIGQEYGITTETHLRELFVTGPSDVTGVSETPTRRRIFTCRPVSRDEARPCARDILSRLATRAYRRPLAADDIDALMAFYERGEAEGGFENGVRAGLNAILASPHFIFRFEEFPESARPGRSYPVSDADLASRLSYFLWGAPPDAELLELAREGDLSDEDELRRQTRRMLADPRAEALATRFAAQWLRLQDLEKIHPDALEYPDYDLQLAEAMRRETELFFHHLVQEDGSFFDLLTADYTFVDERLARHYGIPGVVGDDFRRVSYPDDRRAGVLGHGSVLVLTSHANRTSPVLRGKWVMEVLMGTPPPPPPPGVPDLEETEEVSEGRVLTTRERMEMHAASPTCNSCHRFMDPIGLALDNFDVTGKWRVRENGVPLDTRGTFYDGTAVETPADLRRALLRRPVPLVRTFTENLMAYALGRRIEPLDKPAVRAVARRAEDEGFRMSAFVLGIVESDQFRMQRAEAAATAAGSGEARQTREDGRQR